MTLTFHREHLLTERQRIETLLATTDTFIRNWKDMKNMTDEESFELLKQHCIERFEEEYGEEAYTPAAHVALAKGYLEDERFVSYYDTPCGAGATASLAAAIEHALG